jgi:hypothetical protein
VNIVVNVVVRPGREPNRELRRLSRWLTGGRVGSQTARHEFATSRLVTGGSRKDPPTARLRDGATTLFGGLDPFPATLARGVRLPSSSAIIEPSLNSSG